MSDIFDNFSDKLQNISNRVAKNGKKYIQSAFSKGEEFSYKGKIKLEIEKLKWELKQKYTKLGQYVTNNKISQSLGNSVSLFAIKIYSPFAIDKPALKPFANPLFELKIIELSETFFTHF